MDLNMQSLRLVGYHCKSEQPRDAYSVTTRILWFPATPPTQLHDVLRFACYKRYKIITIISNKHLHVSAT